MKRAALYCRVSSLKQVREGDSLDAQISALRKYVAEHNYLVNAGEYIDDGISGTKFDERDDLQRLLRDVEDGKIDIILVCRIDRWFRSVRHYTATQAILDKLCQLELDGVKAQVDAKNDRIAELQTQLNMANLAASQTAQNAFIAQGFANEVDQLYNRLSNCPVPTTPVYGRTPIFTCNNNGCGCGCNGNF